MIKTSEGQTYTYQPGDEVVVELEGLTPYDPDRGPRIGCDCTPEWSIGTVLGRRVRDGDASYLLRLRLRGTMHLLVAPESSIDGTA